MLSFVWALISLPAALAGQLVSPSQILAASTPGSTCATTTRLVYVSDGVTTNVSVCPAVTALPPVVSTIYVGGGNLSSSTTSMVGGTQTFASSSPTSTSTATSGLTNAGFESGDLAPFNKLSSRASAEVVDDDLTFEAHSGSQYLYGRR